MQTIELGAEKRATSNKAAVNQLRAAGRIPAVVYGGKNAPVPLAVDVKELLRVLKGHGINVLMNLKVGASAEVVLLKDLQRDSLTHNILHADFQRISMTDRLEVNIPIHVAGEAPGVKVGGGILEHILRNLRVRCLPSDIPDGLTLDVSQLQLNQGVKVKDLVLPQGVEVLNDREGLVVNIVAPAAEEVAPAPLAAPGAAAEPEVIAKGKKPEEGEEAAAAGKAAAPAAKGAAPAASAAKEKK